MLRLTGVGSRDALACTAAWLFNPFTVTVSTRGSCESLVSTLMLTVLYSLMRGGLVPAAVLYGLATHLRIYPVVYALPLVLFLGAEGSYHSHCHQSCRRGNAEETKGRGGDDRGGGEVTFSGSCSGDSRGGGEGWGDATATATATATRTAKVARMRTATGGGLGQLWRCLVTRDTVLFATVSAGVFFALGGACYVAYGDDFLNEAFLFHLSRTDIRHNFSPSFYSAYLSEYGGGGGGGGGVAASTTTAAVTRKFLSVLPQLSVVLAVGIRYARRHLPFCLFLQTMGFVAFNKVCTAQYFVWYFCLLPLALPDVLGLANTSGGKQKNGSGSGSGSVSVGDRGLRLGRLRAAAAAWLVSQVHWLAWAYGLEFLGYGLFLPLWAASVAFTGANAWLMVELIRAQSRASRVKDD